MSEAVADRVQRYILDGGDADLRRLLGIAQVYEDAARTVLAKVGVTSGWRAIECGCGPVGALPLLAEMVGENGHVTGVDFVDSTVDRARSVIAELGLENVEVHVGDVNSPGFSRLVPGPFDVAFMRCFLMHQGDLVETLSRITEVVRPGGWIVAHEPMRSPLPRSHPAVDALGRYWELMHKVMEYAGARQHTVDDLPAAALAAGLEIVGLRGFFLMLQPDLGFELHAATAEATKDRAIEAAIATDAEVDGLVRELRAAIGGEYEWVSGPPVLELIARKPADR